LKITCDECGYSEMVPASRLSYEEGKTCPKCHKGKMYWVPPAEEARRREIYGERRRSMPEERRISIAWAIPAILLLGVGGGLALALALAQAVAPPGCLKLGPDKFYYFIYTGPNQTFKAALGECYPVIWTIDVWDEETHDYWPPADPDHDILETGTDCRVMVTEGCTLCGFELVSVIKLAHIGGKNGQQ